MVKNPPAMWETWVRSLGREDPLEERMATHSSILAWRIPTDRGAWRAIVCGVAKTERLSADTHATSGSCCDQSYLMLDFFSRMWFVEFIIF